MVIIIQEWGFQKCTEKKGILRFFEIFFRKFWKLIEVNILYSLFFIPVVLALYAVIRVSSATVTTLMLAVCLIAFVLTIGPATSGMFKILRNFTVEKHAFILTDFKKSFTENYKKSLAMGVIDILFFRNYQYGNVCVCKNGKGNRK